MYREQGADSKGIGVSIPGTLRDDPDGIVEGGGVLKFLDQAPFGKMVRERCGVPCFVENDGKSCALGEYTTGALKGCGSGVVLVLGTGVGGGIVIDGRVYKGAHSFAGEFSFIMERPGEKLGLGTIFGSSCGWSAGLKADLLRRKNLPEDTEMDGHQIFDLINSGDEDACSALQTFCSHLATQIHNLQAILDPEIFAIGGGISNQPVLMKVLQESLDYIYEDKVLPQTRIEAVKRTVGSIGNGHLFRIDPGEAATGGILSAVKSAVGIDVQRLVCAENGSMAAVDHLLCQRSCHVGFQVGGAAELRFCHSFIGHAGLCRLYGIGFIFRQVAAADLVSNT